MTNKRYTYIPQRMKSVNKEDPYVTGAEDIDAGNGKSQQVKNTEVDETLTQLSNEIDAVNKQDIIPVDTLPAVATADPKKIYRVVGEDSYTDYMVNATHDGWKELATYSFPGIDDEPIAGSDNLVKSGGVQNELALGAVYDISAKNPTAGPNNDGKWESLSALLSDANLNTLIPTAVRKGGMSVKFVLSSDNNYVQYMYIGTSTAVADFTNIANWQGENIRCIPIQLTYGSFFNNQLQLVQFAGASYCAFSNTHKGEFYRLKVDGAAAIGGSFAWGVKGVHDEIIKVWKNVDFDDVIEITEDGQTICISQYDGLFTNVLSSILYKWNEEHIKEIENDINEINAEVEHIGSSLPSEKISLSFIDGSFFNSSLQLQAFPGSQYATYNNTKVGETYRIIVNGATAIGGNFCWGVKNQDENVVKYWKGVDVNELITITQNGQVLCFSQYDNHFSNNLYLLKYIENEKDIISIKETINDYLENGFFQASSGIKKAGCLDFALPKFDYNHIIVFGQSFAVGNGTVGNLDVIEGNYMLGNTTKASAANRHFDTDTLQPLRSQINGGNVNGTIAIECTNAFSTMWRKFHNADAKFIASSGGEGGKTIEQLSKSTQYYSDIVHEMSRIRDLVHAENKTVGCVAVIFIQGESNYSSGANDKSEYKWWVNKFFNDIVADIHNVYGQDTPPLLMTYETGYNWVTGDKKLPISMAQLELALDRKDIMLGCPSYFVAFNTSNHPSGNGYSMLGEMMAKYMYGIMDGNNITESIYPINYTVVGNTILISCYTPTAPLKIDTHTSLQVSNYGFRVWANGTQVTIDSVKVKGNTIALQTNADLTGKIVEVNYGGSASGGCGNICDSDNDYVSWQTFGDNSGDDYQENKYPVDVNGRSYLGRHLPMQNWLNNFYHNINLHFVEHLIEASVGDTSFTPAFINTTGLSIAFTSSDTSVATISSDGLISIVSVGWTKITISVTSGNTTWTDDLLLIVN